MKQASTNTVKWARNDAGAYNPTSRNASAPTPNTMASDCIDIGSDAPWPCRLGAGAAIAVVLGFGGTAGSLGGGAGHVTSPCLSTVRPRIASSSKLTSIVPSLVLQSSSVRRSRLFEYSVDDCLASRLTRSV